MIQRTLGRLAEVYIRDQKNRVEGHAWDMQHHVDWDRVEILESEPHYLKRRVLEVIWINKKTNNLNLDCRVVDQHILTDSPIILSFICFI